MIAQFFFKKKKSKTTICLFYLRECERVCVSGEGAEGDNPQADSPLSMEHHTGRDLMTHEITN